MNSPLPPDPFEVLGVPRDASPAAIKSAYRKLILQTHPDKIQDESLRAQKQDEFQQVQQAYETLSDDTKRQQYEDQVKLAKLRKAAAADPSRATGFRFEVRTAGFDVRTAAPREYVYEQRKASRSFEDDIGYFADRSSSRKNDPHGSSRRPSRSYDDRKASHTFEEERDRIRIDHDRQRAHDRGYLSERRKNRDRDRRREFDEKYARASFDDDEELDRHRHKIEMDETAGRHRREARLSDDSLRRDSTRRRHDEEFYESERKLSNARDYMERSTRAVTDEPVSRPAAPHRSSTTHYLRPVAPAPPSPIEDTVRRSRARKSGDRERSRGGERHRSSRKDSSRGPIGIVDPPTHDSKSRDAPSMPHSTSSPAALRAAMHPTPRRAETMDFAREQRPEIPPLPRSSTMPVGEPSSTRRRETATPGSSKLKPEPFDSGYSSPGTPDAGPGRRHESEYIVVEEAEPYPSRSSRRHEAYVEADSETESEYDIDLRDISPRRRTSPSTRPTLYREIPTSGRTPPMRSASYAYVTDPRGPALVRADTGSTSRGSPSFLRTGSGFTSRGGSYQSGESSHSRKAGYPDMQFSPREVQFSPKIKREDIVFSHGHGRRGSDDYHHSYRVDRGVRVE